MNTHPLKGMVSGEHLFSFYLWNDVKWCEQDGETYLYSSARPLLSDYQ